MYWRKAWPIHWWFVQNAKNGKDDSKECYLSKGLLKRLLDAVKRALNVEDITTVLPTPVYDFVGDEGFDAWNREMLEYTRERLERLLAEWDNRAVYVYISLW